ncbi:MAG: type II toxin-antitoxin system VapC family toxin [Pseudomonadota bacterium]|nr:type II toxin-antitoxin system VapC family toxin [Pseudomonadota bacterium]
MRLTVDTSALIAVIRSEPEASQILDMLGRAEHRLLSSATLLEASIVTSGKGTEAERLDALVQRAMFEIVPFSAAQASVGAEAFRKYGRGSGHPAKLNFGDCFAYALARSRNLPLLFKGDDFVHTDIRPALKPA